MKWGVIKRRDIETRRLLHQRDGKIAASNHLVKDVFFIISLLWRKSTHFQQPIPQFRTRNFATGVGHQNYSTKLKILKSFARNELLAYAPDRQLPSLPNLNNIQVYSLSHRGLAPEKVRKKCNGGLATGKGTTENWDFRVQPDGLYGGHGFDSYLEHWNLFNSSFTFCQTTITYIIHSQVQYTPFYLSCFSIFIIMCLSERNGRYNLDDCGFNVVVKNL